MYCYIQMLQPHTSDCAVIWDITTYGSGYVLPVFYWCSSQLPSSLSTGFSTFSTVHLSHYALTNLSATIAVVHSRGVAPTAYYHGTTLLRYYGVTASQQAQSSASPRSLFHHSALPSSSLTYRGIPSPFSPDAFSL